MPSKPIENLTDEHRLFEKVLAAMRRYASALQSGEPVKRASIEGLVPFMREFADDCHHGKEETDCSRCWSRVPTGEIRFDATNNHANMVVITKMGPMIVRDVNPYPVAGQQPGAPARQIGVAEGADLPVCDCPIIRQYPTRSP